MVFIFIKLKGVIVLLGVERYEVKLVPEDKSWTNEYQKVKQEVETILGDNVIDIQHIGSTSINGIWAKPILDIAVVVKSLIDLNKDGMISAGYDACGESGVHDRYLFVKRKDGHISPHHIHCYELNNDNLTAVIKFRDFLNTHSEYAQQYCDLKKKLAKEFPKDRNDYTAGKEQFIKMICKMADNEL